jgi:hypothetical protein
MRVVARLAPLALCSVFSWWVDIPHDRLPTVIDVDVLDTDVLPVAMAKAAKDFDLR